MTGGKVVILGQTGRNFAAGMSGGVAYVFDNSGDFHEKVNRELVDLESLASDDISWLRETLAKHQLETGSTIAQQMLDGWPSINTKFVKTLNFGLKKISSQIYSILLKVQ